MRGKIDKSDSAILFALAGATLVIHLLLGDRYGFHRDELATLDDARHLAWGYVAYPPVTPFFGRLSLELFGTSLRGFRFFAALADAAAVFLTGLIAREFGARRAGQVLAALAAVPFCLAAGTLMQYVSFDYFAWVACAYFVVRRIRHDDPRWWLALGASIGFGMMTKYSMLFCVAGLTIGVLFADLRRDLRSRWLWLGAAISLSIFLPNLIWQWQHQFISLDFLRHIHARDVRIGRTKNFLPDQIFLTLFALPLALIGLWFFFFAKDGRAFRACGWFYLTPFFLFLIAQGRSYYLAPAYPVLYAGGAAKIDNWLGPITRAPLRNAAWIVASFLLAANIAIGGAFTLPIAPVNSAWWNRVAQMNSDLAEEIGWPELVETVAKIRDALPPNERESVAILCGNYGEAGAINLYGPAFHLPQAISPINSYWLRGYGDPPPEVLIVVGISREELERIFESCEPAGHISNSLGVPNEETTRHPEIYLCRHLRGSWPELWKKARSYG